MNIEKRNIAKCIILSIVTCGIYEIYWIVKVAKEAVSVKDANDGDEKAASKYSYLFNYVSCETPLIYTPLMAARDLNEYIRTDGGKNNFYSYIKEKKRLGITMMDYIDAQLAKMIYNSNELSTVQSYAKAAVKATKPSLRSSIVQNKTGKKCVKTTWTIPSDIKLDGIEVYRST